MSNLQELLEQKQALERQIQEAQSATRREAVAEIRRLMQVNGLTVADLMTSNTRKSSSETGVRKPVAPKYRNPESGETWTGRGLKPRWLATAIGAGKSLEDFVI